MFTKLATLTVISARLNGNTPFTLNLHSESGIDLMELDPVSRNRELDLVEKLNLKLQFETAGFDEIVCFDLEPVTHLCSIDVDVQIDLVTEEGRDTTHGHQCSTFADVAYSCVVTINEDGVQGFRMNPAGEATDFVVKDCDEDSSETCAYVNDDDSEFACDTIDINTPSIEYGRDDTPDFSSNINVNLDGLKVVTRKHKRPRKLGNLEKWTGCYNGEEVLNSFEIGVAIGSEMFSSPTMQNSLSKAVKWVEAIVSDTNVIYTQQLNVKLVVKHIEVIAKEAAGSTPWDNPGCVLSINDQLSKFAETSPPTQRGLWHLFDACYEAPKSGVAYTNVLCKRQYNKGITHVASYAKTWLTFAHEIGHNFGAQHSFEEGAGTTGGIMDYGTKLLDYEYKFNEHYRMEEMCSGIEKSLQTCPNRWSQGDENSICGNGVIEGNEQCECAPGQLECTCCENCALSPGSNCDNLHNQCCNTECQFKDTTAQCESSDGIGYCRNGHCSTPVCKSLGLQGFCGIHDKNPCKVKCLMDGECFEMEGWKANGLPINPVRNGAFCQMNGRDGECVDGVCV